MYPWILWELFADALGFEVYYSENTDVYGYTFAWFMGASCSLTPSAIYWEG